MKNLYYKLHMYIERQAPNIYGVMFKYKNPIKYIFSGGMATVANLSILYVLTEYVHLHYLISSILAFASSIIVSFSMQKFWTFDNQSTENVKTQFAFYFLVVIINLVLNTFLVYALVEWFLVWYFFAQFMAGATIAVVSFFVYRNFVFKK